MRMLHFSFAKNVKTFFLSHAILSASILLGISLVFVSGFFLQQYTFSKKVQELTENEKIAQNALSHLKNQNQYKINQSLSAEINSIQTTYKKAVGVYQD
ncbi:MAG: hypothetical protein ACREGI_00860, partial [Candidatus Levyibacteriota bacterium]